MSPFSAGALLFEFQDWLPARDGDFALDARAIGNGEDLGDDLACDHGARADLELVFDQDLADDVAGDDSLAGHDVTLPMRALAHTQGAADLAVAAHMSRDHERSVSLDVAH